MVRKSILFCIFFFFIYNIYGQDSLEYNLNQCVKYALENSYLIAEHKIDVAENESSIKAARVDFLPKIDGYLNYFQYLTDFPTYIFPEKEGQILSGGSATGPYPVGLGLPFNLQAGLTIDQVIFDKNFFIANHYTENLSKIDALKKELSEEDIIYNVSINYYKLASLQASTYLIDFNLKRMDKIENMLRSQIANGFAREIDLGRLDLQRSKILSGREDLDAGTAKLKNYLKFLMGMPIEQELIIINEALELKNYQRELLDSLEVKSTQLDLLEAQKEINNLQKEKTSGDYFPKLSAFAHLQAQAQRDAFNFFSGDENWYLINLFGVRLDIPIMRGGDKKKKLELAEIQSSRIELNMQRLQENLKMQYQASYFELVGSIKKVKYAEENQTTAEKLYRQTENLFSEGIVPLPDLLDAESLFREMQMEKVKALFAYKTAEINFMQATGTLLSISDHLNTEE